MTKITDTQAINTLEIKVENIKDEVDTLKLDTYKIKADFIEHKSKCNREQCTKDHDSLIKHDGKLENFDDYVEEFKKFQVESKDHRQELSTNINLLTDKVANIVKTHDTSSDTKRTIISGIIITVLSAMLIGGFTMVIDKMAKSNDENLKHMQIELQQIKHNQDIFKLNQTEIIDNQAQVKKDLNAKDKIK